MSISVHPLSSLPEPKAQPRSGSLCMSGDVGHTLVVGPTGAGKSVLLAMMALQFRRYPQSQVFAFDFGGSIRAAALAMGGDWHDLGGALAEEALCFVDIVRDEQHRARRIAPDL